MDGAAGGCAAQLITRACAPCTREGAAMPTAARARPCRRWARRALRPTDRLPQHTHACRHAARAGGLPHLRRDWARPCPRLRRDWAHPCNICTRTGLAPAHICAGTGRCCAHGCAPTSAHASEILRFWPPLSVPTCARLTASGIEMKDRVSRCRCRGHRAPPAPFGPHPD
jgi:hypothetical protein